MSLAIGTILGLTQHRIKRLFAYSTISHLGFILLAITINNLESTQAFIFYLMQYSLSNLSAFTILIAIGYSLYPYVNAGPFGKQYENLPDRNNSPIQLIAELKGYFSINPILALSLGITLFSFAGIPPLMGFFAKQMVLSAALDSGYIFITIVAILTSVISAAYYLSVIKQIFFDKNEYETKSYFKRGEFNCVIVPHSNANNKNTYYTQYGVNNVILSSYLTVTISILTLVTLLFMFGCNE